MGQAQGGDSQGRGRLTKSGSVLDELGSVDGEEGRGSVGGEGVVGRRGERRVVVRNQTTGEVGEQIGRAHV